MYEMPSIGDVVCDKYRLEKIAGEGGMGIVYAAEHLVLRQRVAVKVLLPAAAGSEAVVERFARESQAAARIRSEHVARIMDAGCLENGAPFLVMEYLEGCDLSELLRLERSLSVADVADILLQALEALAHAHAVGIVHRDFKPANLFVAATPGGGSTIKILDFGISKRMRARPEEKKLTGQQVLGSPAYMSPEQLRNAKEIDGRADLWSLGVVAYELVAGVPPFDGDGIGEIFAAILERDAEPLHVRAPHVSEQFSAVVARCLKRLPEDRWANATELAKQLAPFGTGAYSGHVDRIEQISSCAQLSTETPIETRRVVEALDEAVARARLTAQRPGLSARSPLGSSLGRRFGERKAKVFLGFAIAGIVAAFGGIAGQSLRQSKASAVSTGPEEPAAESPTVDVELEAPRGPPDDPHDLLMDLPASPRRSAPGTPPRRGSGRDEARSSPASRGGRPKFLGSRE